MAVTQGRNEGRKTRTTKTMTSNSMQKSTPTEPTKQLPVIEIKRPVSRDILDTGLEDAKWHYVWVNKDDTVSLSSYYNDGYRFVRFEDVKDIFAADEMRQFLYTEDVNGWVSYGDQNRLMRIPQQVYRARLDAALNGRGTLTAMEKAKQMLEASVEQGKYSGTLPQGVEVNADADSGQTETTVLDGGTE